MYIIKFGGSVITDKTKRFTFRQKTVDDLSKQMKKAGEEAIIVHGAGSFGHILAKKYNLNEGIYRNKQIKGFSETLEKVQTLNTYVLRSLHKYSIPAISIPPHATITLNNHVLEKTNLDIYERYLERKFIPVTFGDVVLDKKLGYSICSGDLLIRALAEHFKPEKTIFVIDEDGLYTSNPKLNKNAELIKETNIKKLDKLSTALDKHADVTGGMKGKLDTIRDISKLGIDVFLLNGNKPDRLYKVLVGEEAKGTIVYGEK